MSLFIAGDPFSMVNHYLGFDYGHWVSMKQFHRMASLNLTL